MKKCTKLQVDILKKLIFAVLNAENATLYAIYGDYGNVFFQFLHFVGLGPFKKCFKVIFACLAKI